ncbi:hypothetical protein [Streptomyces katrae]|uniref:hypothetical protein n=1 Tax=Streptomyces katrae TaxID=68223 RepID=UPI000AA3B6CA|nr:hypothetical protein [Streptomyces katrae]
MRTFLRRLFAAPRPAAPTPPASTDLPDEDADWWGPSWIWVAGDLDDEEADR